MLTAVGAGRNINKAAAQVEKSVVFQSHLRRPPPFVACLTHSPRAGRGMGGWGRTGVRQAVAGQMAPLEVLADAPVQGPQRLSS